MKLATLAFVIVIWAALGYAHPVALGPSCQLDRANFEHLVTLRMQNYASTGDSWSPRASRWMAEIRSNRALGQPTPSLDVAFARYRRYCGEGDEFMAGLTLGEWIGIGLRAP